MSGNINIEVAIKYIVVSIPGGREGKAVGIGATSVVGVCCVVFAIVRSRTQTGCRKRNDR